MNPLRLLSLDFDGTLIGPWNGTEPEIAPELITGLRRLRGQGVTIALNTGRTLALVDQALRFFPVIPDYALTTEREVYRLVNGSWAEVGPWNQRCHLAHRELFRRATPLLNDIQAYVEKDTEARLHHEDNALVGVVAKSEAEMDGIQDFIRDRQDRFPGFSTQRNSVYLRFCHADYDKGSVLRELQRVLGIGPSETFVAGDNFNDLPMLTRTCGHWLACPANSVPEVKSAVTAAHGFVAATPHGHGIIEALTRFFPVQLGAT
ncbi:MAG TPA: HAD family hydrolase [Chthoniobacterales bacterium]